MQMLQVLLDWITRKSRAILLPFISMFWAVDSEPSQMTRDLLSGATDAQRITQGEERKRKRRSRRRSAAAYERRREKRRNRLRLARRLHRNRKRLQKSTECE